jgi:hypothetical protein
MKVIFEKKNSSFANMKSYLDTHLRLVHVVLIEREKVIFEKQYSSFENMKSYLDTHSRVVHMLLILSEDVYFLGPFFSTSGHSRPKFVQPRMKAI